MDKLKEIGCFCIACSIILLILYLIFSYCEGEPIGSEPPDEIYYGPGPVGGS